MQSARCAASAAASADRLLHSKAPSQCSDTQGRRGNQEQTHARATMHDGVRRTTSAIRAALATLTRICLQPARLTAPGALDSSTPRSMPWAEVE